MLAVMGSVGLALFSAGASAEEPVPQDSAAELPAPVEEQAATPSDDSTVPAEALGGGDEAPAEALAAPPGQAQSEAEQEAVGATAQNEIEPEPVAGTAKIDEIVVTGERQPTFRPDRASGATKVDAPLRDIPQSIQVLSRELIEDQGAFRTTDLVQNVSGVFRGNAVFGDNFIFRGFSTSDFLRDGYPDRRGSIRETAGIERLEVLKGPASVLYGRLEPGGTLNYVTKQPLSDRRLAVEVKTDTEGLWRPTVDYSTTNADDTLGLRINTAYEHGPNFRDHSFSDRYFGTAVGFWKPREGTKISLELEALNDRRLLDRGVPRFGRGPANIPVTRLISEPGDDRVVKDRLVGYTIEQRLSENWRFKHALRAYEYENQDHRTRFLQSAPQIAGDPSFDGNVNRDLLLRDGKEDQITGQFELIGDTTLLAMNHKLLVGIDIDRYGADQDGATARTIVASNRINIFDPVYGNFVPVGLARNSLTESQIRANAVYVQDLIELAPQWKLLVGGRFDTVRSTSDNLLPNRDGVLAPRAVTQPEAFSPRAGIVWQPNGMLSFYTSYSESFIPVIGQSFDGDLFDPTTGEQIEAGVKGEWLDGRLGASIAVFEIVKGNISTPDPVNDGFSIQTGEAESKGVEFDIQGSPLPGMNIVANLAYADVQTTKSEDPAELGKAPDNTPSKGGGLRVSYDVQNDRWNGLGVNFGVHYVGERQVNADDPVMRLFLPSYTRWDAGISYRPPGPWWLALNAENLFDKTYYISAHSSLGIYPGAPRAATLTAGYAF